MTRSQVRIVLELEPGSAEAISGVLVGPSGQDRAFYGWISLIALLDSARGAAHRPMIQPHQEMDADRVVTE